ncbi:hypothetical protein Lal_00026268 [Lupinus albus]|nr:hypothetical protein Lal_00026268 [Lupinus albus]
MPVPLAPYPTTPAPYSPTTNGPQSQLVCSGCRILLMYPIGATSVCCAVCNAVTAAPPPGTEMAQLVCGGCHTLLMYIRGATSVQCSCCHTVNLALEESESVQYIYGQRFSESYFVTKHQMYVHCNSKSSGTCQLWELPQQAPLSRNSAPKFYCRSHHRLHNLGFVSNISP